MNKHGFIECESAMKAIEIMAILDSQNIWNDFCYHYNDMGGLWIEFRLK